MRTCLKLSGIAIAVAAASGCASLESPDPMRVVGHQAVRHGSPASDAEAQYALGKYYLGQNRTALALLAFTRAIDYDAGHVEAYNARATAFVRLGDLERAESDLARALERSPDSAHLHNNRGFVRLQRQDYVGAAESLRRAFEIDPHNDRVRSNWSLLVAAVEKDRAPSVVGTPLPTGDQAGLAELRAPEASAPVVHSLSKALSGPVINLEARHLAFSPPIPVATELASQNVQSGSPHEPRTRVVDLTASHAAQVATQPKMSIVHIHPEAAGTAAPANDAPSASRTITIRAADADTPVVSTPASVASMGNAPTSLSAGTPSAAATVVVGPIVPTQKMAAPAVAMPTAIAPTSVRAGAPVASGSVIDVAAVLRSARIEVANGNGVRGMAAKVGNDLENLDYRVARISNAPHFGYERTRIYFRDGFLREALQLSRKLPVRAAIMLDNAITHRSDLRVVVGKDLVAKSRLLTTDRIERSLHVAINDYRE